MTLPAALSTYNKSRTRLLNIFFSRLILRETARAEKKFFLRFDTLQDYNFNLNSSKLNQSGDYSKPRPFYKFPTIQFNFKLVTQLNWF